MGFTLKQQRLLRQNVKREHLRSREIQGRELSYIEGWHAIDEANRIFGFDGWDRETLETKCVLGREIRGQFTAIYLARVRIRVRAEGEVILREGQGTGEAQGVTPGEAHDKALKSAETDATKRALATFGRPFGLGLYLGATNARPNASRARARTVVAHGGAGIAAAGQTASAPSVQKTNSAVLLESSKEGTVSAEPASAPAAQSKDERAGEPQRSAKDLPRSMPRPGMYIPGITAQPFAEREGHIQAKGVESPRIPSHDSRYDAGQSVNVPSPDNDDAPRRIDKSVLTLGAPKRFRDKKHLLYVASQPCLVCDRTPSDAHHLRFAQSRALGRKVSDEFTVPLCRGHHRQLHHSGNEMDWWQAVAIDPLPLAEQLWQESRAGKNAHVMNYTNTRGMSSDANTIASHEEAEIPQALKSAEQSSNCGEQV